MPHPRPRLPLPPWFQMGQRFQMIRLLGLGSHPLPQIGRLHRSFSFLSFLSFLISSSWKISSCCHRQTRQSHHRRQIFQNHHLHLQTFQSHHPPQKGHHLFCPHLQIQSPRHQKDQDQPFSFFPYLSFSSSSCLFLFWKKTRRQNHQKVFRHCSGPSNHLRNHPFGSEVCFHEFVHPDQSLCICREVLLPYRAHLLSYPSRLITLPTAWPSP
mmetsp:Transcript_8036/g.12958  ORF Transcript_8036/g.12958 Transcript_8036/m.12958 type:complete len:212 (-) Transcript_8036:493-1128(-)